MVWLRVCTSVGNVTFFDIASSQKTNPNSGIGNAAFFDIAYRKKESTCAIHGLHRHQIQKIQK